MNTRLSTTMLLSSLLMGFMLATAPAMAKLPGAGESIIELWKNEFSNLTVSPSGKYISAILRRDDRNTLVIMDRATGNVIPGKSVKYDKRDRMEVMSGQWIKDEIFAYNTFVDDGQRRPGYRGDIFLLHMDKPLNERVWHWKGTYEKRVSKSGDLIRGSLNVLSILPDEKNNILVSNYPYKRRDGGVRPNIYKMNISTLNFDKVKVGPARGA